MLDVLLIDEDPEFRQVVPARLNRCGIRATTAADGDEALVALDRAGDGAFDAILLDVALRGENGLDLLDRLRERDVHTPVLLVSASSDVSDRIRGFEHGADDFITKPFDLEELAARIDAVVRRTRILPVYSVRGLNVDVGRRVVEGGGRRIELSPREFDVLRVLVEARGEVVSRCSLLRDVWGIKVEPGTTIVEVQIARLRKKLQYVGPSIIQTFVGQGYRIPVEA